MEDTARALVTMPTISVVTAVLEGRHQHLPELYESLLRQDLPPHWKWQWVVQEDGQTGQVFSSLPDDDPRISMGMGPHAYPAGARTLALTRVAGVFLRAVDADDLLPANALARDIEALLAHPEIAWCTSAALDLLPHGKLRAGPRDPGPGPLAPGLLARGERDGWLQVLAVTMTTYTELVWLLGGWTAVRGEDVSLLLAAEAVSSGWFIQEPGLLYRRWEGASTVHLDKREQMPPSARRDVILGRASALRRAGIRWTAPERIRRQATEGGVRPEIERNGSVV